MNVFCSKAKFVWQVECLYRILYVDIALFFSMDIKGPSTLLMLFSEILKQIASCEISTYYQDDTFYVFVYYFFRKKDIKDFSSDRKWA